MLPHLVVWCRGGVGIRIRTRKRKKTEIKKGDREGRKENATAASPERRRTRPEKHSIKTDRKTEATREAMQATRGEEEPKTTTQE